MKGISNRLAGGMYNAKTITYAECGSGKTENLKVIAMTITTLFPDVKLVIMLPYPWLLQRVAEQFKKHNITIREEFNVYHGAKKDTKQMEFAETFTFKAGITLTTPEFLAAITLLTGSARIEDLILLVDEIDMISPAKSYAYKGAEHFMQARCVYGCTASELTTDEQK